MPYPNLPEDQWGEMDRCVEGVMAKQGLEKERAIAICYSSISGKSEKEYSQKHPGHDDQSVHDPTGGSSDNGNDGESGNGGDGDSSEIENARAAFDGPE